MYMYNSMLLIPVPGARCGQPTRKFCIHLQLSIPTFNNYLFTIHIATAYSLKFKLMLTKFKLTIAYSKYNIAHSEKGTIYCSRNGTCAAACYSFVQKEEDTSRNKYP